MGISSKLRIGVGLKPLCDQFQQNGTIHKILQGQAGQGHEQVHHQRFATRQRQDLRRPAFEKFLQDKIKVDGRVGNLGETVQISQIGDGKIEVIAHTQFSGRYLKYLTKKFLKKQQLRDWLRVVSTSKGVYELRFFNVVADADEEDDE